jgi:hypothetical protein
MVWMKLQPMIYELREKMGCPGFFRETEYLHDKFIEYSEEHPELQLTVISQII